MLFWGGNFTATKIAFRELDPLAFTAVRFAIGTLIMGALVRWLEGPAPLPRGALWRLLVLGLIGNSVYQLLFIEGLARTTATTAALVLAAMPTVVTFFAGVLGIEQISRRQAAGTVLATLGVVLVVWRRDAPSAGGHGGEWLTLAAVFAWSAYMLLLRYWALPISSLRLTAWTLYTGTPFLVLIGLPAVVRTDWSAVSVAGWGGLAYSMLLSLVAAYVLWNRGVRVLGASRTAVFTCITPLVAAATAMVALGERPALSHLLGGGLIVGGVLLSHAPVPVDAA